jgi:hypothetical protein
MPSVRWPTFLLALLAVDGTDHLTDRSSKRAAEQLHSELRASLAGDFAAAARR